MAYVKRIPIKTNLKGSLKYILNPKKTEENILISASNCSLNLDLTYKIMEKTKEEFNKKDKILGIHFIQSFSEEENINPELAHEVGKKWAESFLEEYEYMLATHQDKEHIHNHIIINSVSFIDGKKYLKNDKELDEIRNLSDKVCKEFNLSIIIPNKENRNRSYKEWKSSKQGISWKDKIKIDINETIKEVKSYEDFIFIMKEKSYELKYGDVKYNTFRHPEMGRNIRGQTLGDDYTEDNIKKRIIEHNQNKVIYLDKYRKKEDIKFNENKFFKKAFSNKEIIKADIDISIQEASNYKDFLKLMKDKGYILNYGNVKHNTFKHIDMKRATRGATIGQDYTEGAIKERIIVKEKVKDAFKYKDGLTISRNTLFNKRYINNKFKYLSDRTTKNTNRSKEKQEAINDFYSNLRKLKIENKVYDLMDKYDIEGMKDVKEKLSIISLALDNKNKEYNDRLKLLKNYSYMYEDFKKDNNLGLGKFQNLKEFEEAFRYQKKILEENEKDMTAYERIQKDLRFINIKVGTRQRER